MLKNVGLFGIVAAVAFRIGDDLPWQFTLFGSPLVLLLFLGLFFSVSGWRKVFLSHVRHGIFAWLGHALHVPRPMIWAVILGEYFGGLGLLSGVLWREAAMGLVPIMAGAFFLWTIRDVRERLGHPHGTVNRVTAWIAELACSPELLILVMLGDIVFFW